MTTDNVSTNEQARCEDTAQSNACSNEGTASPSGPGAAGADAAAHELPILRTAPAADDSVARGARWIGLAAGLAHILEVASTARQHGDVLLAAHAHRLATLAAALSELALGALAAELGGAAGTGGRARSLGFVAAARPAEAVLALRAHEDPAALQVARLAHHYPTLLARDARMVGDTSHAAQVEALTAIQVRGTADASPAARAQASVEPRCPRACAGSRAAQQAGQRLAPRAHFHIKRAALVTVARLAESLQGLGRRESDEIATSEEERL